MAPFYGGEEKQYSYTMRTVNVQNKTRVFFNQEYKAVRNDHIDGNPECFYPFSAFVLLSFDSSTVFFIDTACLLAVQWSLKLNSKALI